MQEKKMPAMPVFLLGEDYWKGFDKMIGKMIALSLIKSSDTDIFQTPLCHPK